MVDLQMEIPNGFLDKEVRCNYLISNEMKKAWAVMLDLLAELDRVCKKYQLTYYANGGTLLGAVRHRGFIPWDDDIDVMMFRNDYEKLMSIGPQEFKAPYFLQNKYTDPTANDFLAKLRNSDTTAIFEAEKNSFLPYNKGIFIDIFPLDNVPDNEVERKIFFRMLNKKRREMIRFGQSIGIYSDTSRKIEHEIKKRLYHLLSSRRKKHIATYKGMYKDYEVFCSKYNSNKTKFVTTYVYGPIPKLFKYYDDLKSSVEFDFEFIKIPVCSGYDHYLKNEFGNYWEYVIGTSMHNELFFDTNNSYREYVKNK